MDETTLILLRRDEEKTAKLAQIDEDVARLAKLLTGDGTQPSGRWGSAHEMLQYLIEHETRRKYGASDTVKVRVSISVQPDGSWDAYGRSDLDDEGMRTFHEPTTHGEALFWLTAELPVPAPPIEVSAHVYQA